MAQGSGSKVGIIGNGNVGTALSRGLRKAGYEFQATGSDPEGVRRIAGWADIVVLAVPYAERENAIRAADPANLDGKTLVDVTNALGEGMTFAGSTEESGAEQVARWAGDGCCVVKAFNTVFAPHIDSGKVAGERLTLFCAGDDKAAKGEVLEIGQRIGFDAVDAGPLETARWLEPLGYLNMALAFKAGLGADSGFRYVHAGGRTLERPERTAPRGDRAEREAREARAQRPT